MLQWLGMLKKYEHSVIVATHVIDNIAPDAGEVYRVRALLISHWGNFKRL